MGDAERALLEPGPVVFADDETDGSLPASRLRPSLRRARGRQGQALRARLRASLTAPARAASSALARPGRGNGRQPNQETGRPGPRDRRDHSKQIAVRGFRWEDEGKAASRPGVPVPVPTRCREAGNGNRERSVDQGFASW